jgi:hypothetical protein
VRGDDDPQRHDDQPRHLGGDIGGTAGDLLAQPQQADADRDQRIGGGAERQHRGDEGAFLEGVLVEQESGRFEQIPEEPWVQRLPLGHGVRGALLDDIGGSEGDGSGHGNHDRDRHVHGRFTRTAGDPLAAAGFSSAPISRGQAVRAVLNTRR